MGKRSDRAGGPHRHRSKTLPSSPSHSFSSSSSSDFEFTISISPRNTKSSTADELFYKGQLLPLHLSPRISMVRNLLLSDSSTSTSVTTSRDSTGSTDSTSSTSTSSDLALLAAAAAAAAACDSSRRPSPVADDDRPSVSSDDDLRFLSPHSTSTSTNKKPAHKYFSLSRFSSVFKNGKDPAGLSKPTTTTAVPRRDTGFGTGSGIRTTSEPQAVRRSKMMSSSAKDVIRKYLKKVKPLYEKVVSSQPKHQHQHRNTSTTSTSTSTTTRTISETASSSSTTSFLERVSCSSSKSSASGGGPFSRLRSQSSLGDLEIALLPSINNSNSNSSNGTGRAGASSCSNSSSFSAGGNLKGRSSRRSYVASCPSSMRSSPNHSGILNRAGLPANRAVGSSNTANNSKTTSFPSSGGGGGGGGSYSSYSTMEELQSAIQGAIAHCKNSMLHNGNGDSNTTATTTRDSLSSDVEIVVVGH